VATDRDTMADALRACAVFTGEEVRVALEMIDQGLAGGPDGDYALLVADVDGRGVGYVCVGRTPLTRSTWHLYWICVHPSAQGRGVGRCLQAAAEAFVIARGGERVLLETSGTPGYAAARVFYERAGYAVVGRVADFYRPGDDCIMYCKALDQLPERVANHD
jgi:ribosomal protein S18 acetylase RimI-like enzyme